MEKNMKKNMAEFSDAIETPHFCFSSRYKIERKFNVFFSETRFKMAMKGWKQKPNRRDRWKCSAGEPF